MMVGEALFIAVAVGITAAGVLATVRATGLFSVRPAPARWTIATDGLRAAFGSVGAFYAVLVASVLPLILITWPLGAWSRHKPLSSWNDSVLHAYDSGRNHTLTQVMRLFTQMGNWYQIVTVALVASALLAWASKSKRWLPALVIISTLLGERYLQKAITNITKVHHPPTDLGTFPSGGVARLVCVYGIVGFMALRVLAPRSRRALVGGVWLLTLLTWIEGYSRIHLQKHWLFDPIGGLILGVGILAVALAASTLLPWPEPAAEDPARHRGGRRRRQRAPTRLRAGHVPLSRDEVGEVVLDGIAENGDPAPAPPVAEAQHDELVSLTKAAADQTATDASLGRARAARIRAARVGQALRRVARSAHVTSEATLQATGESADATALDESPIDSVDEAANDAVGESTVDTVVEDGPVDEVPAGLPVEEAPVDESPAGAPTDDAASDADDAAMGANPEPEKPASGLVEGATATRPRKRSSKS